MKIILASTSPRRKELLCKSGIDFEVVPSTVKEELVKSYTPIENVKRLARIKCLDVAEKYPDKIVLGADTIVVFNNKIYGKPKDEKDAYNMLKSLSGNTHQVMTGFCIYSPKGIINDVVISDVAFFSIIEEEIIDYIKTGEPMDKAGSYAIQGLGAKFVKYYDGDFDNIIGLPLDRVLCELKKVM